MGSGSPDVVLYDSNGNMLAVQNGVAIPASTPALLFAGSDGTNSRYITIDGSGRLVVVGAGTAGSSTGGVLTIQGIAGGTNVPVSQGTNPWVNNITQFGGTNLSTGTGTGGAGIPRVTVSNDSNILVTQSTSPWVTNVTQFGSNNIVTGTGASGAGIPRITVSNDSNILATQSGTWTTTVTQATAANLNATVFQSTASNLRVQTSAESATAAAPPTNAIYVGGLVTTSTESGLTSGDMYALSLTTTGLLRVDGSNVTQPISGTVTANQGTSPWVTNVTQFGGNNVVTGTGTSGVGIPRVTVSNDSNILATQSGTWIVQPGNTPNTTPWLVLSDGYVTSSLPSYSNNTSNYLSLTTTGLLRVDGSNVNQPVVGIGTAGSPTGGVLTVQGNSSGTPIPVSVSSVSSGVPDTTPATQNITTQDLVSSSVTGANSQVLITGTPTTNSIAAFSLSSWESAIVEITGTWTGTLQSEVSNDGGTTWTPRIVLQSPTDIKTTSFTANFIGDVNVAGYTNFRMRATAAMTGTATVRVVESIHDSTIHISNAIRVTDNSGHYLPAMDAITRAGFQELTDGTNGPVNVKSSNTASIQSDLALVVANSPNTPASPGTQIVQTNATVTTNGSTVILASYGWKEISLFVNIKNAPTGTTPTITYTMSEVDPGDQSTLVGSTVTGAAISAAGTQVLTLEITKSPIVKVSWTVTGTTPSFTGVYTTVVSKLPGVMIGVDSSGNQHPLNTDSSGNLQTVSPGTSAQTQDIAIGKLLAGGAAANNTFSVERTTYTEQSSNAQRSVSSSSANDTAAGTGARTIIITYYPVNLSARKTETITLNGTTTVNTVNTDICYIESIKVVTVGTGGTNAGTISLFAGTGGTGVTIGSIALANPGSVNQDGIDGRTYWAHHYVVSGKTCTIVTFDCGTQGNQNAEVFLTSKDLSISNAIDIQISDSITVGLNSPTTPRSVPNTIKILGPAKITLKVIPAGNNTAYFGSFDFYEG